MVIDRLILAEHYVSYFDESKHSTVWKGGDKHNNLQCLSSFTTVIGETETSWH